jgi:ATP-binding protein involved in chromosome partitioning
MSDPRLAIIERRFDKVGKVIAVSSGKGGVGKSMVATSLALNLKDKGFKVGLLDLDFTSPATHVILGVEGLYPEEEYGIIPPLAYDMRYMSITHYSLDEPAPLRGTDVSNAIIELLAITKWGELDYLVVDMPPGIGDATLDTIRLVPKLEFVVITTPSKVAYQSVRRLLVLFKKMGINVKGVIENMVMKKTGYIESELDKIDVDYLGSLDYCEELESALGNPDELRRTDFYIKIGEITPKII